MNRETIYVAGAMSAIVLLGLLTWDAAETRGALVSGAARERLAAEAAPVETQTHRKVGSESPAKPLRRRTTSAPITSAPQPPEWSVDPDPLRQGSVLTPARGVSLGLTRLRGGSAPSAWLDAGDETYSYLCRLQAGESLRAGGYRLEVSEIDLEERWIRFRSAAGPSPKLRPLSSVDGVIRLQEMRLYRLPDGATLTVGKVRRDGQVGLRVYPPGYADDTTQGYDNHPFAASGEALGERYAIDVLDVQPSRREQAGYVELRIARAK